MCPREEMIKELVNKWLIDKILRYREGLKVSYNPKNDQRYGDKYIREDNHFKLLLNVLFEIKPVLLDMLKEKTADEEKHNGSVSFLRIKQCGKDIVSYGV